MLRRKQLGQDLRRVLIALIVQERLCKAQPDNSGRIAIDAEPEGTTREIGVAAEPEEEILETLDVLHILEIFRGGEHHGEEDVECVGEVGESEANEEEIEERIPDRLASEVERGARSSPGCV